jgi:hypothetical protein
VCPSCPDGPSNAWILVVDVKGCSTNDNIVATRVDDRYNYILVLVECKSCEDRD